MAESESRIKSVIFKMPAWQILLLLAVLVFGSAFFVIKALSLSVPHSSAYFVSAFFIILISINGNSIMNEGGLDIATLLHFGITVVFGIIPGFLAVLLSSLLAFYFAEIQTPIDFFVQKNTMKIWIQTAHLFFTTVFLWAVLTFRGADYILANLILVYILAFTAGRSVKTVLLATIGRVPIMKIVGGTIIFYLINWYLIKFFGAGFLNFLKAL